MANVISKETKVAAINDYVNSNATLEDVAFNYDINKTTLRGWLGNKLRRRRRKSNAMISLPIVKRKNKSRRTAKHINSSKPWSKADDVLLRDAVENNYSVKKTIKILCRTAGSIYSRKHRLIVDGFFKNKDIRFPRGKNSKVNARRMLSNPIAKVIVEKAIRTKVNHSKDIVYNELAQIVKLYGVSVTISITESGTEVKMHN